MTHAIKCDKYQCKCGGFILVDVPNKRTMHSLPTCPEYDEIVSGARPEGFAIELPPAAKPTQS